MQKLVRDYLDELKKKRKKHRRARIAVMLLIVLVVGTVTGGLTRNGITMTEDARCGLIEHVHTDECYQEVLICGYSGLLQEEGDASDSVQDASASDSLQEDPVPAPEEAEEQEEFLPEASAEQAVGHRHTDDCYELRDVLLCSEEESEGHTHTDDCYEIETSLECGEEESEGHTHTDACYETETEDILVCDPEDDEEHEHTDDCYEPKIMTTMICGEKESEGHTHTEECVVSESVLVCSKEEYTGHEHTDDCYGQEEVLICGQEEREEPVYSESSEQYLPSDMQDEKTEQTGDITQEAEAEQHIHTEDCYELQPVCGIPEHTHSEECLIDTSADVEDASEWDAQYADVEWADAWGADLVTAAQMQVGYRESVDNYRIAEDGSHKGYTRYGAFAGDAYVDWDAAFVNFCMYYAGLTDTNVFPQELDAGDWYDAFVEADEKNIEYLTIPDGYEPEAGDLIFFEREKEEEREEEPERMMGIVSSYDEEQNTVTVIEGNSDNEVRENTYDIDDEQISAYLMITTLEESVKADEPVTEGTGLIFTTEDVEDASDWDAQYEDVEWTGAWGADLVTAAQIQIGYMESLDDFEIGEDKSFKGYTRYGAFAGDEYADWDAAFVNFCMYYAGLADTGLFPQELDAGNWYDAFAEADEKNIEYLTAPDSYEPKAGDLIFFEREEEEGESGKEMGIVSSYDVEQNEITVIEGDSNDEVRENTYDTGDGQISSYLMITALEESVKGRVLTAEGEDYTVEVRFTEEAGIPEDAVLDVREITADSDEYQIYCEQSLEALGAEAFSFVRCFDITFLVDGEKIEPTASVDIRITYADTVEMDEEGENNAVHFAQDGTEVLEVETDEEGRSFHFSQDSFSVTVTGTTTGARAIGGGQITEFKVTDLNQLVGKQFLIANASLAMKGENKDGNGLLGVPFADVPSIPKAVYFWTFERVAEGSNEFYIKNVSTNEYVYMGTSSSGNSVPIGTKEEEQQRLTVGLYTGGDEGKICIASDGSANPYYINNSANGGDKKFIGWKGDGSSNIGSKLTLYTWTGGWDVVLNPGNTDKGNSSSHYNLKIDNGGSSTRIVETIGGTEDTAEILLPSEKTRESFALRENSSFHSIFNGDRYQWKLKGWYNIATGEYYLVDENSDGRIVTVSRTDTKTKDGIMNVFYADWVAAEYNVDTKSNGTKITTLDSKTTEGFITTEVFDYNDLVNLTLADKNIGLGVTLEQISESEEEWSIAPGLAQGTQNFTFRDGKVGGLGRASGGAYSNRRLTDPTLNNKNCDFFKTLFSNSGAKGVEYLGKGDGLYTKKEVTVKDKDGNDVTAEYYEFNSDEHAAVYNRADQRFYLYDGKQYINPYGSAVPAFLPFNTYDETKTSGYYVNNQSVNYWFGMKTEIDFWLNDDIYLYDEESKESGNLNITDHLNLNNNVDMEFSFEGDDDVWVFVDDKLILNLSGIHGSWSGIINFSTGLVTDGSNDDGEAAGEKVKWHFYSGNPENPNENPINLSQYFGAGSHTLTMYYMERGANMSNCKIKFNLMPTWKYEAPPVQAVSATKKWVHANGSPYTDTDLQDAEIPDVTVELYEEGNSEASIDTQVLNSDNGWTYTWRYLDKEKNYIVQEGTSSLYERYENPKTTSGSTDSCWIETGSLTNGDEIIIGSEVLYGGTVKDGALKGKVLSVDSSGNVGASEVEVSKEGDVQIEDCQKWIVCMDQEKNGHKQFQLKSALEGGGYLSVVDALSVPMLVGSKDDASVFYFSQNGNLTGTSGNRLVADATATELFTIEVKGTDRNGSRVHIYKYIAESTCDLKTYTFENVEVAAEIKIQKVDRTDESKKLRGAEFELRDENNELIRSSLTSDGDGMITIDGLLRTGTYSLKETKAPDGYALLESPIEITVVKGEDHNTNVTVGFNGAWSDNEDHMVTTTEKDVTVTITVPNIVLYTLPDTGGIGIYWYMFGGVLLMISAVLITYKTKLKGGAGKS